MEIQVPLGHRVWGSRKGRGKEGSESWVSIGKSLQPDPRPRPGALGHELQDRVSPTLRPGGGLS